MKRRRHSSETVFAADQQDEGQDRYADRLCRRRIEVETSTKSKLRGLVLTGEQCDGARILLTPGFGQSIRNNGFLAAHIARCGHEVWRFDLTNHVGASDGTMADASLGSATNDIVSAFRHISARDDPRPIVVIAASLSARAAIRALTEELQADLAIFILPVVNLEMTIEKVAGTDLISQARAGELEAKDEIDILGHAMSGHFIHDAINGGFDTLSLCRTDLGAVTCPITVIAAEDDDWVSVDDIRSACSNISTQARILIVQQDGHNSYSFDFMRLIGQLVTSQIVETLKLNDREPEALTFSDLSTIIAADRAALDGHTDRRQSDD